MLYRFCLLIMFQLMPLICSFADNEVGIKLLMIGMSISSNDTISAWSIINGIDSMKLKDINEDQLLAYYQLRSLLEDKRKDNFSAAASFGKVMDILEKRRPSDIYIDYAYGRTKSLKECGNYLEAERVARHALVRGSAIIDSCWTSSALFTLLAEIKELQGDTLFSEELHEKAQQQSLRLLAFSMGRDSTDIMLTRFNNMNNELHAMKHAFSRKEYSYIQGLNQLAYYVNMGGNAKEAVRLCEQSLQLARDSMLTSEPGACTAYQVLLSAYVMNNQVEKAKALLPVACDYYKRFPELGQTEEGLCSILGEGLFQTGNYNEAFPYLQQMEDLATKKGRPLGDYWKGLVRICKELR